MRHLLFGRGAADQEDQIVGMSGELRIDTSRNEIRVHDGSTPGGNRIPSLKTIEALIANTASDSAGEIQVYSNEAELADAPVSSSVLAIVNGIGYEDAFVWHPGTPDSGDITSGVAGFWRRLDSQSGFAIRMWRAGLINLSVSALAPSASQDVTAWVHNGALYLWDGTQYLAATPTLFARLLASVGGYYTGDLSLPDRIASLLTDVADLNTVTGSGWYRTTTGATHSPLAGVHAFEHRQITTTNDAIQTLYVQGSSTQDRYVRYLAAGTWGSWVSVSGQLPTRLGATAAVVTDANNAVDSGFYQTPSTASNIPTAATGTLISTKYSSTEGTQIWINDNANAVWMRRFVASAWGSWFQFGPTHGLSAKASVVDTDEVQGADSAASYGTVKWLWSTVRTYLAGFFLVLAGNQTVTGGFKVTPNNLGNIASFTVDPTLGNYQYGTNHGAATITAPANDCAVDILLTNDASAGAYTFSGFTVASGNTGDALDTTSGHKFLLMIRRINGVATYIIKALQ